MKHSLTTVMGREVYLGPRGEYGHAKYFHLNLPGRQLGFGWSVLKCFEGVKISLSTLTLMLFDTLLRFLYTLFSMTQLKKLGTTTRFALQPFNPFYEYNEYFVEVKNPKGEHAEEQQSNVDENTV